MTFKEICKILEETEYSTISADVLFLSGQNREIVCQALWISCGLTLLLLFFVPMNGIILYHSLQSHFGLPAYSNFIIGFMSYTMFHLFRKIVTEDNLLSIISNKVFALFAMIIVFFVYMRGGI